MKVITLMNPVGVPAPEQIQLFSADGQQIGQFCLMGGPWTPTTTTQAMAPFGTDEVQYGSALTSPTNYNYNTFGTGYEEGVQYGSDLSSYSPIHYNNFGCDQGVESGSNYSCSPPNVFQYPYPAGNGLAQQQFPFANYGVGGGGGFYGSPMQYPPNFYPPAPNYNYNNNFLAQPPMTFNNMMAGTQLGPPGKVMYAPPMNNDLEIQFGNLSLSSSNGIMIEERRPRRKHRANRRNKRRNNNKRQKKITVFQCNFCFKNNESEAIVTSHMLRDTDGTLTCPILMRHICPTCGSTGKDAHTKRFCPMEKEKGEEEFHFIQEPTLASVGKKPIFDDADEDDGGGDGGVVITELKTEVEIEAEAEVPEG